MTAEEIEEFYEGFSNATIWPIYHDLVAKPEFHREWWDAYVSVNHRFAEKAAEHRRQGRHGVGARLPAPAGPADAARAAARPADRVLPAHPVPAGRAVPAAAVAPADPRGPARRRPGRLPAARRGRQLRAPGAAAGRPQDPPRPDLPARRPHGAGRGVPDLDRLRAASRSWPGPSQVVERAKAIREALGNPSKIFLGHRPARLHQGHLRAAARLQRADQRRSSRRRGRRVRPGGGAVAGAGRAVPRSCATTSTAWSAGSTATWAGSAGRRSATCTRPTRARRWRRSTAPPTSWWSRRSATA